MNLFDLTGKTAVVTGARRGIGAAIATALAEAGADIVGVSLNMPEDGAETGTPYGTAAAGLPGSPAISQIAAASWTWESDCTLFLPTFWSTMPAPLKERLRRNTPQSTGTRFWKPTSRPSSS